MRRVKAHLKEHLRNYISGGIVLAYSGGVDSSVLLAVLSEMNKETPFRLRAVIFDSAFQTGAGLTEAFERAMRSGVDVRKEKLDQLAIAGISDNPEERCYLCKRGLFARLLEIAKRDGFATVMDGTNADDAHTYRPGLRALEESGVVSPLKDAGLTKTDIRAIAREMNLNVAERPAAPCLATRFPYGAALTESALRRVANGEAVIRAMLPENTSFRLRVHGDTARVEVTPEEFGAIVEHRLKIVSELKKLGYRYITLDLEGFRSGSMDALVKQSHASINQSVL